MIPTPFTRAISAVLKGETAKKITFNALVFLLVFVKGTEAKHSHCRSYNNKSGALHAHWSILGPLVKVTRDAHARETRTRFRGRVSWIVEDVSVER